jgi:hypothetical protein
MTGQTYINTATCYQLYLGTDIEILGRTVGYHDFLRFLEEEVIPNFKSFSVTDSTGYWKGKPEPIKILTIITGDYEDAIVIKRIAEAYKKRFYQDAVLVNTFSCFPNLV